MDYFATDVGVGFGLVDPAHHHGGFWRGRGGFDGDWHHASFALSHGIVIDRGSSGRPAVVQAAEKPQRLHFTT
jgi:alpha-glucuronidase